MKSNGKKNKLSLFSVHHLQMLKSFDNLSGEKKIKAEQTKLAQPIKGRLSNGKVVVINIFAMLIYARQHNRGIQKFLR